MLMFLGVCGFVMQFLLTMGLSSDSSDRGRGGGKGKGSSRATNMIYTNMLFALGLDRVVFGTVPSWWSLGGSGLILGSAVWVAISKSGDEKERERERGREEVGGEDEEMALLPLGVPRRSVDRENSQDVEEVRLLSEVEEWSEDAEFIPEVDARLRRQDEADGVVGEG
jgi:hypothetical protein